MGGHNLPPPGWDRVNVSKNLGKACLTIDYASASEYGRGFLQELNYQMSYPGMR